MSLKVGDRVVVKREELDDPDGWLYAKHETEERDGYVPCGYLEVVGAAPDEYTRGGAEIFRGYPRRKAAAIRSLRNIRAAPRGGGATIDLGRSFGTPARRAPGTKRRDLLGIAARRAAAGPRPAFDSDARPRNDRVPAGTRTTSRQTSRRRRRRTSTTLKAATTPAARTTRTTSRTPPPPPRPSRRTSRRTRTTRRSPRAVSGGARRSTILRQTARRSWASRSGSTYCVLPTRSSRRPGRRSNVAAPSRCVVRERVWTRPRCWFPHRTRRTTDGSSPRRSTAAGKATCQRRSCASPVLPRSKRYSRRRRGRSRRR